MTVYFYKFVAYNDNKVDIVDAWQLYSRWIFIAKLL